MYIILKLESHMKQNKYVYKPTQITKPMVDTTASTNGEGGGGKNLLNIVCKVRKQCSCLKEKMPLRCPLLPSICHCVGPILLPNCRKHDSLEI